MKKRDKIAMAHIAVDKAIEVTDQMIKSPNGAYEECSVKLIKSIDIAVNVISGVLSK